MNQLKNFKFVCNRKSLDVVCTSSSSLNVFIVFNIPADRFKNLFHSHLAQNVLALLFNWVQSVAIVVDFVLRS